MSIKQEARALAKAFFEATDTVDDSITANQFTDLIATVTEHDYSAKTVRARLRRHFTRDDEFKNATWRITLTVASEELEYYMKRNVKAS